MSIILAIAAGLALSYALGLIVLAAARPKGNLLNEALRLLRDVLGLLRRLLRDPAVPRGVRARLWLLLAYLAMPFDLVPDFIPVLGYADDAIVVILVLRSVVRRAGASAIERHWRGTDAGLVAVTRLAGLPSAETSSVEERAHVGCEALVVLEQEAVGRVGVDRDPRVGQQAGQQM